MPLLQTPQKALFVLSPAHKGLLFTFVGAILFSSKAIFIKLAYRYGVGAVDLLALRMLFSLPFFLLMLRFTSQSSARVRLSNRDWFHIFLLGVLGYYLAGLFDFIGLQYITASLERLVLFSYPAIVVLISAFWFKKRISRSQLAALLLTYLGIAAAFWGDFSLNSSRETIWGCLWILAAALAYALYLTGSGQMIPKLGALRFNALAMTGACLGVLTHGFIDNRLDIFHFAWPVYAHSAAMAVLATVLPSFLISAGIGKIGAGNASVVSSVGPVSTVLLAYIFLGEPFMLFQLLGTALVLAGVWIIGRKQ